MRRRNKYRAKKATFRGITFGSKKERDRYVFLFLQEKAGRIKNLEPHPRFELIPKQIKRNGRAEGAAIYTADSRYEKDGQVVIEDVKSPVTVKKADYILRRKLMLQVHGIEVQEVFSVEARPGGDE